MRSARSPTLRQQKATHSIAPAGDRQMTRYSNNYRSRIPPPWPTYPWPQLPIKPLSPPSQPPMRHSPRKWVPQPPPLRSYSNGWQPIPVPPTNEHHPTESNIGDVIHWNHPCTAVPMAMHSASTTTSAPENTRCRAIKHGKKSVHHGRQQQKQTRGVTWRGGP